MPSIAPEQKDILPCVGMTMLIVQTTEQIIRLVMTYVIQGSDPLTIEHLQSLNRKDRNKTVGFLLCELRKRVDLDDTFDNTLRQFVEMKNTFIHNLDETPGGWSLGDEQGRELARKFLTEFGRVIDIVLSVFVGLVRSWQEEVGMSDRDLGIPPFPFLADIDAKFKPIVGKIFFAKE